MLLSFILTLSLTSITNAEKQRADCKKSIKEGSTSLTAPRPKSAKGVDYTELGFYRVGAAQPELFLGNAKKNAEEMAKLLKDAVKQNIALVTFPEMAMLGYTLEDGFLQDQYLDEAKKSLKWLMEETKNLNIAFNVGMPYMTRDGRLYNTAFVIAKGKILGVIPKSHLPNYKEFRDRRWFRSGKGVDQMVNDKVLGTFRLSPNQLFELGDMTFAVEICEDVWANIAPSNYHTLAGANVVCNLSASNELVGKKVFRLGMVEQQSARTIAGYIYSSSGVGESSKDIVFGGHRVIAENGGIIESSPLFEKGSRMTVAEIDVHKLQNERRVNKTHVDDEIPEGYGTPVTVPVSHKLKDLMRKIEPHPFVPKNPTDLDERSELILEIQANALARRALAAKAKSFVLGLSGGRDSTWALMVMIEAAKILGWKMDQLHLITMPGLGTTKKTKNLAIELAKAVGATLKVYPLKKTILQGFKDIEFDGKDTTDVTFENGQARPRTTTLFNYANLRRVSGIVVGTGDLSELCLGYCTYNADQQSHYGVNAGVPKTLIEHLIRWYTNHRSPENLARILNEILALEISPELLPPGKNGEIEQKSEDKVGPYELHDFFIKAHLRDGFGPKKMYYLARLAFKDIKKADGIQKYSPADFKKWLKTFFRRFYSQQFKRDNIPGGPKVGSVSVSPRGDWRFPAEIESDYVDQVMNDIDSFSEE